MSGHNSMRVKHSVNKASYRSFIEHFSETRKAERLTRFVRRNLEIHKSLQLQWFVDYGFEFPHLLISQNLEKFCTLSGTIYPHLVKKFYANLRKDAGSWVTEVNRTRIEFDLDTLEEVSGLRNSGLGLDDFKNKAWAYFNPDSTFAACLRSDKFPGQRKAELMKVNDFLLHHVVVHILLPRSFDKAIPTDEDLRCISALNNGVRINWADVVMNFMIRRFNDPNGALPYPLLISKIIENAGVNVANELRMFVEEKGNMIDRLTLIKMKIIRANGSWQWLEDAFLGQSEEEAEKSLPPSFENLMAHMEGMLDEHSKQIKSFVDERLNRMEERIEYGITLMKTFLESRESTCHSSFSES